MPLKLRDSAFAVLLMAVAMMAIAGAALAQSEAPSKEAPPAEAPKAEATAAPAAAPAAESSGDPAAKPATEAAATDPASAKPAAPIEIPWEVRPYVVRIDVSFAADSQLTASLRQEILTGLERRLRDDLGPMWDLEIRAANGRDLLTSRSLAELTTESAKERWLAEKIDKIFPVVVEPSGGALAFSAREWDRASQDLSPLRSQTSPDVRLAPLAAGGVLREVFRPLCRIESVDGKSVVLKIRAGELIPPDASAAPFAAGDLLTPFYVQYDKKVRDEVKRVTRVSWTLLKCETIDRARIEALTVSSLPSSVMPGKRRLDALAIKVKVWYPQTELQVVPRTNPGNPYAGGKVDVVDRMPTASDPVPDRLELRTNRRGMITVPAESTPQIRYAIVNSGKAILGRVPFCPGAQEKLTLEVIDDSPRLSVEGEVSLLEADLVELIARRKILTLRAEAMAKEAKLDEARALLAELKALPDQKTFQQRIDLVRTAGVEGAKKQKDPVAETRIRKMCATLQETASTHLDQEKFLQSLRDLEDVARIRGNDGAKKP